MLSHAISERTGSSSIAAKVFLFCLFTAVILIYSISLVVATRWIERWLPAPKAVGSNPALPISSNLVRSRSVRRGAIPLDAE